VRAYVFVSVPYYCSGMTHREQQGNQRLLLNLAASALAWNMSR
jgi:hypothetical protein